MNSYLLAIRKFTDFDTRTNRTDYWMFVLFNTFFAFFTLILDSILNLQFANFIGPIRIVYSIFIFLPALAVTIRRLHDTNRSGWNILFGIIPGIGTIYLFYLLALEGDEGDNYYLPDDSQKELIPLHDNDQYKDTILTLIVIYLFIAGLFWFIISKFHINYYESSWYKAIGSIELLIWGFIPLCLALLIKSETKRIIAIIVAVLFCLLSLFRLIEHLQIVTH